MSLCQFQPERSEKGAAHLQKPACNTWIQLLHLEIFSPLQVSESPGSLILLSVGSPHKTSHVQSTPFQESVWEYIQPDGSACCVLSVWRLKCQVLHSKLAYCTCLTLRDFLGCIETKWQNMNKAMDLHPFLLLKSSWPSPTQLPLLLLRKRLLHKVDNLHWPAAGGSKYYTMVWTSRTNVATVFTTVSIYNSGKVVGLSDWFWGLSSITLLTNILFIRPCDIFAVFLK